MRLITLAAALIIGASTAAAQDSGPTVTAARAAFFAPTVSEPGSPMADRDPASCGSSLKNAAMLGLGFSLATAVIELMYTLVREPFVRNGHDVPGADPTVIVWAGGAGFIAGLVGTEMCRRRR